MNNLPSQRPDFYHLVESIIETDDIVNPNLTDDMEDLTDEQRGSIRRRTSLGGLARVRSAKRKSMHPSRLSVSDVRAADGSDMMATLLMRLYGRRPGMTLRKHGPA